MNSFLFVRRRSLFLPQLTIIALCGFAWGRNWTQPIGVPTPSFGVTEDAPAAPSPWASAVPGFYYVDTTSTCSDTSNPNGWPGNARCTIPSALGPGSYVEVHGTQNYDLGFTWNGTNAAWVANTSGPVWVRGQTFAARPIVRAWGTNGSSFVIIENVNFQARNTTDQDFGIGFGQGTSVHHIVVRDSEVSGGDTSAGANGAGIGIGDWNYHGPNAVHDIVIDHVSLHDVGALNPPVDVDNHCIILNGVVNTVWVTNNAFARCGGDSMQIEAQDTFKANIHHVYFGRNTSTTNRQSGGWVKNAQDVIFSQNEADTFAPNSGGPGACFGGQYDHDFVWYLFNACHDSPLGITLASDNGAADNIYVVGNRAWHITSSAFDPYNTAAFQVRGGSHVYYVNNSVFDYIAGITSPQGTRTVVAVNNIFQNRNNAAGFELYDEGATSWQVSNNLFDPQAALNVTPGAANCTGCLINVDPRFVSTATPPDMHLQTGSPAIDAGIVSSVYATFLSRYGIDISKDITGAARPLGAGWDMGAYEAGGPAPPPPAPSFTLSTTPSSATVQAGGSATYTVSVSPQNGFTGAVALSVSGLPAGVTGTFSTSTVTAPGTANLTLASASTAAAGVNTFSVTGTSGTLTASASASLAITAAPPPPSPSFVLAITPSSASAQAGGSTTYTVSVSPQNGFTGAVALSVSGLPAGVSGTFSTSTVTAPGTANLTLASATTAAAGVTTFSVKGSSGTLTTSVSAALSITAPPPPAASPSFALSISPGTAAMTAGGAIVTYTVAVSALNGFSGQVALTVSGLPAGVSGTFSNTLVSAPGTTNLLVLSQSTTTPGSYNFAVNGSNGTLTGTAAATVAILAPPPVPVPGSTTWLSNIAASPVIGGSATITWTSVAPSTSTVIYGTAAANIRNVSSSTLVTSHSITLTGLTSGVTYHYVVTSADATGVAVTSQSASFVAQ